VATICAVWGIVVTATYMLRCAREFLWSAG
jgi:hypothetical protein